MTRVPAIEEIEQLRSVIRALIRDMEDLDALPIRVSTIRHLNSYIEALKLLDRPAGTPPSREEVET